MEELIYVDYAEVENRVMAMIMDYLEVSGFKIKTWAIVQDSVTIVFEDETQHEEGMKAFNDFMVSMNQKMKRGTF